MKEYDLIVMNPPFSTGSSHLMKVLDLQVLLPKPEQHSVILERLKKAQKQEEATPQQENTQVADGDFLKAIVNQFQLEVTAGVELIREYQAMQPHILDRFERDKETGETVQKGDCILQLKVDRKNVSVNRFLREVREKYWRALFSNEKFTGQLTSTLQGAFYNKVKELKD